MEATFPYPLPCPSRPRRTQTGMNWITGMLFVVFVTKNSSKAVEDVEASLLTNDVHVLGFCNLWHPEATKKTQHRPSRQNDIYLLYAHILMISLQKMKRIFTSMVTTGRIHASSQKRNTIKLYKTRTCWWPHSNALLTSWPGAPLDWKAVICPVRGRGPDTAMKW